MKILSLRRGFLADHSSTSYEFLAVDKPLGAKAKAYVRSLSSRVRPTARRASFIYHGEWSDLPGGWEPLLARYYDVMYRESYDWWTLAMAFSTENKRLVAKLKRCGFRGKEDLGVDVSYEAKRLLVTVYCRLDAVSSFEPYHEEWYGDEDEEETDNPLLDLLSQVRKRLKKGDCQALYAVWEQYGFDDEAPPRPRRSQIGAAVAEELAAILEPI